jgi:hypothetical protein
MVICCSQSNSRLIAVATVESREMDFAKIVKEPGVQSGQVATIPIWEVILPNTVAFFTNGERVSVHISP